MTLHEPELSTALDPAFVGAVLNAMDKHQARALNWGFFDLTIAESDIEAILEEDLPARYRVVWERLCSVHGYTGAVLASELAGAHLLYADPTRPGRYRTRFAEGVRLIARLRQTFRPQQWATAPTLVSDLKVRVAERRFPERNERIDDCWEDLRPFCRHPQLQQAALRALARTSDRTAITFAAFQRRAFKRVLAHYGESGLSGTVVSAGTGAGKTKAFYIPALLGVIADIADNPRPYTKVIAVYPRNVLLADQLREVLSEAAKLRSVLDAEGLRDLTFGALLGDTPPDASAFEDRPGQISYVARFTEWERRANGWEIPYLRSPVHSEAPLEWRDEDRRRGRTALYRTDGSNAAPDVPDGVLRITRDQLRAEPPDVLFLSLEMLNQHMGNPEWARAFGLDRRGPKPRLLLLDEVHTHEGIAGAQAAWVLRRWRHWGQIKDLHVVGLSATLRNAPAHLGTLAGLPASSVAECLPLAEEFEVEDVDVEYNVVVKGNPAAGTSLLATSIQTAMLLPRLLTPRALPRSRGASLADVFFGRKAFGFTDKLDVVNRWLSDLTDAEVNKRLPSLRSVPSAGQLPSDTLRAMERDGQVWRLPHQLGHNLGQALTVTRCSSQDPGATAGSDLIVATSSLEVGYDDPDVGATLHHKRPRSMASFIQRKGRAGRRRRMRPWTLVVLSDYGADRWAFQNAEVLLAPEVGEIGVPLANAHVLRMQSAYFLLDWIGRKAQEGNPSDYLRPSSGSSGEARLRRVRSRVAALLNELLAQGEAWHEFQREFRACFGAPRSRGGPGVQAPELDALLWQAPRPLLLEAVPELLRKLERTWQFADPARPAEAREDAGVRRPMPHHIPSATFAELEVGEAVLSFDTVRGKRPESLSVAKALSEAALGNVSKRYSVGRNEPGYWHPFSARLTGTQGPVPGRIPVADLFADRLFVDSIDGVSVYEPQVVPVVPITRAVRDTSKGSWVWQVHVHNRGEGLKLPVLMTPAWEEVFADCVAYLHRDFSRLEVLRYSRECRYEIRDSRGNLHVGRVALSADAPDSQEERGAAVGFRKDVDGIVFRVPQTAMADLPTITPALMADLRGEYFRQGLRQSASLTDDISVFLRDWLWQTSVAMLTATAAHHSESLQAAQGRLGESRARAAKKVLDSIFQMRDVEVPHGDEEARLKRRLEDLWNDRAVVDEVVRLESRLWEPIDDRFQEWARQRFVATLAQALRAAALARVSELTEDDVAVDVLHDRDGARIVLSEVESGGVGVVERIVAEIRTAPEAFHTALRHHISWCPRAELAEAVAGVVRQSLGEHMEGAALREAFARARAAESFASADAAMRELRQAVDAAGYASTRRTLVALVTRLLQPGTPPALDALVADLDDLRGQLARSLELWPGGEAFAYHTLDRPELRDRLSALLRDVGHRDPDEHQLFAVAQRLLIEGCRESCPECLDQPNRFTDFGKPARNLTEAWLRTAPPIVSVAAGSGWREEVRHALLDAGAAALIVQEGEMRTVVPAVQEMLAEEVPSGYLLLPVSLSRVRRRGHEWELILELRARGDA